MAGGPPGHALQRRATARAAPGTSAGDIIFAPTATTGIFKVPAIGGEPVADHVRSARTTIPTGTPGSCPAGASSSSSGVARTGSEDNDIFLAALDTTVAPRIIAESQTNAEYARGHLLTVREDVLMATPFTPDQERVLEGGTPLVEDVLSIIGAAVGVFSALRHRASWSSRPAPPAEAGQWSSGRDIDERRPCSPWASPGQLFHPSISPDGKRAVVEVRDESNEGTDLWLVDLDTGLRTRFTFAPG